MQSGKAKQQILAMARKKGRERDAKLTQSGVRVNEDFSEDVRDVRRKLFPHMVEYKNAYPEAQCFLGYDKLICGNETFVYDAGMEDVREVSRLPP